MARLIGRANLRKRLERMEGADGTARYGDGRVEIETPDERIVVRPAFGLAHEGVYEPVRLGPLWDEVERDHVVAVLLVRLGGYAAAVLDGERVVDSKVGSRFVKNRNKKGGSSSNRFRRRRGEQARALVEDAADAAARVLGPWRDRAPFAALGGDRRAVEATLAARADLGWLADRALPRFHTVPDPRRDVVDRLGYLLYAAEMDEQTLSGP